jgi:hypothetical protein
MSEDTQMPRPRQTREEQQRDKAIERAYYAYCATRPGTQISVMDIPAFFRAAAARMSEGADVDMAVESAAARYCQTPAA